MVFTVFRPDIVVFISLVNFHFQEQHESEEESKPEEMETTSEPVDPDDIGLSEMKDLTTVKPSEAEVTEEVESDDDSESSKNVEKMDVTDAE